jgi:hypothetical protein
VAQVVYLGNGSDGGQVPVDSNTYASGNPVNVADNSSTQAPQQQTDSHGNPENIVTGNLSLTGAVYLYWNTEADGSGTIYTDGSTFTFPNQTGNLTLYAQWGVTTGLTAGGVTTHYAFYYDESLGGPGGIEPARTNAVIANCEADFSWMQTQFAGVDITNAMTLPIPTYVTALGGGAGWGPPLTLKPGNGAAASFLRCLMVAEVSEMLMSAQSEGWGFTAGVGNEESDGEGLSLFMFEQFQIKIGLSSSLVTTGSSDNWLNSSLPASNPASTEFYGGTHFGARTDYVNSVQPFAGNGPATGCSLLFIYYLFHQLGFSIPDIIAAAPGLDSSGNTIGGACLRGVYRNLTGDTSDPFPYFAGLLAAPYPPNQVASIPGPDPDDPWPLGSLSFLGAKNTWGSDEITDIIAEGGTYTDGFYLALDGFSKNIVGGTLPSVPTVAFGGVTTALSANPPKVTYQSSNPTIPQQILFAYDVNFAQPLGTFSATETPAAVNSSISVLATPFPATTEFFFLAGADPYFTNVVNDPTGPSNVSVPWLSEDLRVFTATPGASPASQYQYPVPGGPRFVENSSGTGVFDIQGAYGYIQNLLVYLNQTYGDPSGKDPFAVGNNIIPQQQTEFTADSSVTPFSTIGGNTYNNYSFGIARVRLKGTQAAGPATGVRVFFRVWGTQTADTGWDPTYTYLSHNDGSGNPLWPQAPSDDHTLPFFATSAQPDFTSASDPEFQTGGFTNTGANNLTITIEQGDSQWSYFGCFLNVNDGSVLVNGVAIPNAFPGTHHCLVAQIAYPGAPIETAPGTAPTTPESGSQLAQRNLQVTTSDNPGPPATHRVPQTFDVKPSGAPPAHGRLAGRPDELMIEWGEVPPGSTARIYWPAVSSTEVIQLASWMYGPHQLTTADAHTIEVRTIKGVTFVPIPQGTGDWFAGLFTLDLPQTVVTGQEFDIVVRRIGKRPLRTLPPPPPPPPPPPTPQITLPRRRRSSGTIHIDLPQPGAPAGTPPAGTAPVRTVGDDRLAYERYIVGSFQVKIPVSTGEAMLPAEETTLAILKARLEAMPKTDRWYLVLLRYIGQITGRVDGLGGDGNAIPPSLGGYRPPVRRLCEENLQEFTGKVCEVVFDCFGDFVGFVLDDCCEHRAFESREREIGDLVLRALKERLTMMVVTAGKKPRVIRLVAKG